MTNEERQALRNKKIETKNYNLAILADCVLPYFLHSNVTVTFDTPDGKVCFYPSTDKYQHKGVIKLGNAHVVINYVNAIYRKFPGVIIVTM